VALSKQVQFQLSHLLSSVDRGEIGLPDLQRPFVWPNKKVRDLFDSMYCGYPVGYLLLWQNGAADDVRAIGSTAKQAIPQLLVIDGQQRLTSLYAVVHGMPVLRQNFKKERIPIAFQPLDGAFKVADAAIRRDPKWISDISEIWAKDADLFRLVGDYLEKASTADGDLSDEERRQVQVAVMRLYNLKDYGFTALQLSSEVDEEQVAEVFVRINSKGTPLNQADFILTLMSVFRNEQRFELEDFCRWARVPPTGGKRSPFNHFIEPDPDHLLRVAVGLGFRRARLQFVYSILRGKDLETGEFSEQRRVEQFDTLAEAQDYTLDLQNWKDFLKCLRRAGYRSGRMVTSRNALLFSYVFYLIGKRDYRVDAHRLRLTIARWFFFVALTGRYTTSPESQMEQDLANLREVNTADGFLAWIERTIGTLFTNDYWQITLPNELATSSARSPSFFAYCAALILLDARALFSGLLVRDLLDPTADAKRSAVERHHLFPKAYLQRKGVRSWRDINQIANYALVEWDDNGKIGDREPSDYFPEFAARADNEAERGRMHFWHALPEGWQTMPYAAFLAERRQRMAEVVRRGFATLAAGESMASSEEKEIASEESASLLERTLEVLEPEVVEVFRQVIAEDSLPNDDLRRELEGYLETLEAESEVNDHVDLETARDLAERCDRLLDQVAEGSDEERRSLVQAATRYFIITDDARHDWRSAEGFEDDRAVVDAVERILADPPA